MGFKKKIKNILGGARLAFFLPYRFLLRGNKSTLGLTVMIMSLIFINLVFVSSVLLGVIDSINKQSVENLFGNIVVEPEEGESYIKKADYLKELINETPGVTGLSAHYIANGIFVYDKKNTGKDVKSGGWQIKSVSVADERSVTKISQSMVEGNYLEDSDLQKVVIGKEISGGYGANLEQLSLGVAVGDKVTINFGNGVEREYEVKGIFDAKNIQADSLAFITEKEMESVLDTRNRTSEIIIRVNGGYSEEEVIKNLRQAGVVNEKIKPWQEYAGMTISMVKSFDLIKFILQAVALLVAISTIFIISFVNITSRKRQIGILKAIGMDKDIITTAYIFQALFYAASGIIIGAIAVYAIIVPYFIERPLAFPIGPVSLSIDKKDIIFSALFLLISAIIGGFVPSSKVAKENIVDAIWGA